MSEHTLEEEVLIAGLEDWVDESWVAQAVQLTGAEDADLLRITSIGVIAELISMGHVIAGDLSSTGHIPWSCSPGEAIVRVARTWLEDWRDDFPTPGAVVWLANTDSGDAVARAALAGGAG